MQSGRVRQAAPLRVLYGLRLLRIVTNRTDLGVNRIGMVRKIETP